MTVRCCIPIALAVTLTLGAAPAAAAPSPDAAALDAHFEGLETDDMSACFEFDKIDTVTRQKHCEAGLKQLQKARKGLRNASIGQAANFDYWQVKLQAGLSAAYSSQDRALTSRSCKLIESNVAIRVRLKQIPETELSARAYQAYQNTPKNMAMVVDGCRAQFGTPKGAPNPYG